MPSWPWRRKSETSADTLPLTLDEYLEFFTFQGNTYGTPWLQTTMPGTPIEPIPRDFIGFANRAYMGSSVVFACILVRMLLFSEARFQFRRYTNGRPSGLFGTADLAVLENPWPGGTTGDLLRRALLDSDLAGNSFTFRAKGGDKLRRLRPDWVSIVLGTNEEVDPELDVTRVNELQLELVGYIYWPGGPWSGSEPQILRLDEVAHFAPIPDPLAHYRGMSWLRPCLAEVMSDAGAEQYKLTFFENSATPNLAVLFNNPNVNRETFDTLVQKFKDEHTGATNAYKTLFLAGGADVKTIGVDLKQLDFKASQGMTETRIAACAGVPPVIVGLSEGLDAATYSNYAQARRRFSDGTIRPLWRDFAGSLETIIAVPTGAELWYDDRDIPFVQEDQKDFGVIQRDQATAISTYVMAGFTPESAVSAVDQTDLTQLVHTGLPSVQLQPAPANNGGGANGAGPGGDGTKQAVQNAVPEGGSQ